MPSTHLSRLPLLLLLLGGLGGAGCQASGVGSDSSQIIPLGSTYLIHVPGIAGDTVFDRHWMDALRAGGAADAVRLFDWTCNDPGIDALQAYARNHREAGRLAGLIASRAAEDPSGRILLTAESGGAAVVVWALEQLPPDVKVSDVVLVAPALSPAYDLTAALRHVNGKVSYFSSPGDWFVLGFGTRVFGTSDGRYVEAAGYVGFEHPARADSRQYAKLRQLRYDPEWMRWGDFGNHTGGLSTAFARQFIAPLLVRERDQEIRLNEAISPTAL